VEDQYIKYAWSSITQGACNYGNWLIEWSLEQILKLPKPLLVFDSFKPLDSSLIEQINRNSSFVISPGCTTLQVGQNKSYEAFDRITVPKPCFGGCLWQTGSTGILTILARAIGPGTVSKKRDRTIEPDLSVARNLSQPIGSRDTYTHEVLKNAGIESYLIGCPTLLSQGPVTKWRKISGNKMVVSLSRFSLPAQLSLLVKLRRRWDITVMIHEPYEKKIMRLISGIKTVEFESPEQFINQYKNADIVVTGRLHGVLPAIRFGTRVVFYGNPSDTRLSLLGFLGVPIRKLSMDLVELNELPEINTPSPVVFEKANELRRAFVDYSKSYGIETNL